MWARKHRNMMFVTLEDQHGIYEVILFPEAYDKYGGLVYETRAMRVTRPRRGGWPGEGGIVGAIESVTEVCGAATIKQIKEKYQRSDISDQEARAGSPKRRIEDS